MHVLAYYYHWSVFTLWQLPRTERKMWVNYVKEHVQAENNANSGNTDPTDSDTLKVGGKEYRES